MFKTILFPIDQSRESREAADVVANLVKTYNARLIILSIVETPEEPEKSASVMSSPTDVAKLLETAQKVFADQGIPSETLEREGMVAFVICDVADEVEADMIVMGCRGLGLTEEGLAESVTNRVINLSPCPVLIVP